MKTEVDLVQLAEAVSAAILQFAQPVVTKVEDQSSNKYAKETPKAKKRGRPKKIANEDVNISIEEESDFTAPAKNSEFSIQHNSDTRMAKRVKFKKRQRQNNFVDDLKLAKADRYNRKGEKIVYPEHAPPRKTQEEKEYTCGNCGRTFKAFPSYIPPRGEGGHQPVIKCHDCNTK